MMYSRRIFVSVLLLIGILLIGCSDGDSAIDKQEPIVFGDEGWDSIRFHNEVAGIIIEEGYGYEAEQLAGSDVALWQGIEKGEVDVHMEAWTANIKDIYTKAIESGNVDELSVNYDDNYQGLYVPTFVIEGDEERGIEPMAPDLKYIGDLSNYSELFADPDDPNMGAIIGATPGWSINEMLEETVYEYGLDEMYNYISPGSEAAINASLVRAYENGEPWVGYNYEPNWIMGLYDMTALLEEDPEGVIAQVASQDINIVAHVDLSDRAPDVVEFLENYETTSDIASEALTYIQEEDASAYEAAVNFLQNYEDLWTEWVPEDIAEKVKAAIQ